MPAPLQLVDAEGRLTPLAIDVLAALTGIAPHLLAEARIRPAAANWLRAPWYPHRPGGGALTIGRTIWFTGNWFATGGPGARGDASPLSTWRWLRHLAHEAGHLPQAEHHGRTLPGKARYVARFTWQYASRALLLRRPVHDGAPLEIEADRGRWVLERLAGREPLAHPLVTAVVRGDHSAAMAWLQAHRTHLRDLHAAYPPHRQPARSSGRS